MAKVLVRHREAQELESKAKQQASSRAASRQKAVARGEFATPPEASLLGMWQHIEEEYTANGIQGVEVTLGDKFMVLDHLSPQGELFGRAYYSNFSVIAPMNLGVYPKTVEYSIDGYVNGGDLCEFMQTPIAGDIAQVRGVTVYYYPIIIKATWEDHLLFGSIRNDRVGLRIKFKAVKLDQE